MKAKPIAVLLADIHLSHNPPVARTAESDWYAAQDRILKQVCDLQKQMGVPVICAGDIFDKWNVTPELINWAIDHLPKMLAVPGQHDLPLHRFEDVAKSAYCTLEKAGVIVTPDVLAHPVALVNPVANADVYGFPWGVEIKKPPVPKDGRFAVAVVHSYCWTTDCGYPGAPMENNLTGWARKLKGYSVAVFGDNHQGFFAKPGGCTVYNCGCLIPRKSDERHLGSSVGLLFSDAHVERRDLDTTEDKWLDVADEALATESVGLEEFLEELGQLNFADLDFKEAVTRYVRDNGVSKSVEKVLLEVLEEQCAIKCTS